MTQPRPPVPPRPNPVPDGVLPTPSPSPLYGDGVGRASDGPESSSTPSLAEDGIDAVDVARAVDRGATPLHGFTVDEAEALGRMVRRRVAPATDDVPPSSYRSNR